MTISLITAVYNREQTIGAAIECVGQQSYSALEYIVVDGMSTDATPDIIKAHNEIVDIGIREPDNGIYDALNKGIEAATGDVIGFLHADDLFHSNQVLSHVAKAFENPDVDAVYGDLTYVDYADPDRIIRYWKSRPFSRLLFRRGWMPPHPTVYIRREIYEKFGNYRTDLGSAADYECMLRLMYKHQIRADYVPEIFVKMRVGGQSNASLKNRFAANREDYRAWKENGFRPPFGLRFTKPLSKIPQFFRRPPKKS